MTKAEWYEVVGVLRASWPAAEISKATAGVWYEPLADVPAAEATAALRSLIDDGREFPPNGGIIRKRAKELAGDVPDGGRAWELMCDAAANGGGLSWIASHDRVAAVAAQRFGFRDWSRMDDGLSSYHRAAFLRFYDEAAKRVEHGEPVERLERGEPRNLEPFRSPVREPRRLGP